MWASPKKWASGPGVSRQVPILPEPQGPPSKNAGSCPPVVDVLDRTVPFCSNPHAYPCSSPSHRLNTVQFLMKIIQMSLKATKVPLEEQQYWHSYVGRTGVRKGEVCRWMNDLATRKKLLENRVECSQTGKQDSIHSPKPSCTPLSRQGGRPPLGWPPVPTAR